MQQKSDTDMNDLHQAEGQENPDQEWQKVKDDGASGQESTELTELKTKFDELEDKYKRLWADQQNIVNRFNREKQDIHKYAAANTLGAILPALDNFDFAKKSLNENTSFDDVIKSLDMLQEQLVMSLKGVGLEEIPTDIPYNPELHEAVSNVIDPEKEEGTILEVLKKGFKVNDKVLRVATVVVSTKQ